MAETKRMTSSEADRPLRPGQSSLPGATMGPLPDDLDEVLERLIAEFCTFDVITIDTMIRRCSADLDSVHQSARAEMVE